MNAPRPEDDRAVERLLRLAGPAPPPEADRAARVEAALREALAAAARRRRSRRRLGGLAAAAALLLALLAIDQRRSPARDGEARTEPTPVAAVAYLTGELVDRASGRSLMAGAPVGVGAEPEALGESLAALRFPGERSLRLDSTTRLRLLAADRVELLEGGVYVDSPPGAAVVPLRLVVGGYEIVEIGTQFEVRRLPGGLIVRVREGQIELLGDGSRERVVAGWRLEKRSDRSSASLARREAPDDPAWAWVWRAAPPFPVEGRAFGEFLAWYRRETGLRIRIDAAAEPHVVPARLHGSITGLGPDAALEMLAAAVGLRVEREGSSLRLVPVGEAS